MYFLVTLLDVHQLYLGTGQRGIPEVGVVKHRNSEDFAYLGREEDPACMRCSEARPVKRVTKLDRLSLGFRVQLDTRLNESMEAGDDNHRWLNSDEVNDLLHGLDLVILLVVYQSLGLGIVHLPLVRMIQTDVVQLAGKSSTNRLEHPVFSVLRPSDDRSQTQLEKSRFQLATVT